MHCSRRYSTHFVDVDKCDRSVIFSEDKMQGGQNFFEKIRTKIRTFLEKNPYNPYIFWGKIRTIRTFFFEKIRTIRTIFLKKSVQSVQFLKKILTNRTFKKNVTIFEKKT